MESAGPSDEELLSAAGRDPEAFEELYRRHVATIVAFAVRRCSVPAEVPDLVAAVWLEVIGSADRFNPGQGRAVPWLLGIAANLVASDARRRGRERQAMALLAGQRVLEEDDYERLESEIDASRRASHLRGLLVALPERERMVVELVIVDGLSPQEAAEALGIRPAAARMRLARARRRLREAVRPDLFLAEHPVAGKEIPR